MSAFNGIGTTRCSATMVTGTRKRTYRGTGSYTKGTGKKRPCPSYATRTIDNQLYCDAHCPKPTMRRKDGRWQELIGGHWVPQQTYLREDPG